MHCSFSALDAYFGLAGTSPVFEYFDGDLVALAGSVSGLSFPGLPYADAEVAGADGSRTLYRCDDAESRTAFIQTELRTLPGKRHFEARGGVYESLAEPAPVPRPGAPPELVLFEAAILASRYDYHPVIRPDLPLPYDVSTAMQRDMLDLMLDGAHPDQGFDLLRACGFIDRFWPELADLGTVEQSKDYHPEGDGWRHTMETFSHRKTVDPLLSMALLLHDTGKPEAESSGGKRFDGHSELGARTASGFLARLGYDRTFAGNVAWLVRYHMLPAALPRIPVDSTARLMDNALFPTLLELYRCDELSTFRGPDGYYEACSVYRSYRKHPARTIAASQRRRPAL